MSRYSRRRADPNGLQIDKSNVNFMAYVLDQCEVRLFVSQQKFDWLIREVKRRLYRRPQGVMRRDARQQSIKPPDPLNFDDSTIYDDAEFHRDNYERGLDER